MMIQVKLILIGCLSTLLSLNTGSSFPQPTPIEDKATLALIYTDLDRALACPFEDRILSTTPEINLITIAVNAQEVTHKIAEYRSCQALQEVYDVPDALLALIPNDPIYASGDQWNLSAIDLPAAWDLTIGSASVIVAVIDTGISTSSSLTDFGPDGLVLGASIINGITREDTVISQYSYDGGSHGTAVASLIGANMNAVGLTGIAPGVKIMPLKVFRDASYANELVSAESTDIATAIIWAVNHGADLINMSFGGSFDTSMQNAVHYAASHGVLLVAASGNDSRNYSRIYRDVSYPAAYSEVIAVGSINASNQVSDFSNSTGKGLELSAYGENIVLPWIANNGYYYISGTSFSAPTVTGVLALMLSLYPDLSTDEAKAILLSGVKDLQIEPMFALGWDQFSGYGLVNANDALRQAADYYLIQDGSISFATSAFIYGHHAYSVDLQPALDTDYFKFTLYEPDDVTITVSTGSLHDLVFEVFNGTYSAQIVVDEGGSGVSETVTLIALPAGNYYIKVTDFAGRAYADPYHIEVDYRSVTPALISALSASSPLTNGQISLYPVQINIVESLYHTVSLTKNGTVSALPADLLFTENGNYTITVDDVLDDPVSFSFSIAPYSGVQNNGYYNTDRTLAFLGSATLNGSPITTQTSVTLEGSYELIITNGDIITLHFTLDKTNPIITIDPYSTTPTNQDVTITASANEGILNASSHLFMENGSFTFSATDQSGNTTQETVTISHIFKVSSVTLNTHIKEFTMLEQTYQFTVTVAPSDALDQSVTWSSSDPSIASVDQTGMVTAIATGTATITVASNEGNHIDSAVVNVVLTRQVHFTVSGFGGSIQGNDGVNQITSDTEIKIGSSVQFIAETLSRYRLYRWTINGVPQSGRDASIQLLVSDVDLIIQAEFGLMGDLNDTDNVSTTDLVIMRRTLAGLDTINEKALFNADLNGDGSISTTDLVQLRRFLAGLD